MDVQYHCTNKIYIGESIQEHDQDLSSKGESARVSVGFTAEGLDLSGKARKLEGVGREYPERQILVKYYILNIIYGGL